MLNQRMDFPQAEWSQAGSILMHTPGQELFNGVIHPSAGLFEYYFDVDKAAAEHKQYINMLEANNIRVYTIREIFEEVDINNLRSLAEKLLTYDISHIDGEDATKMAEYRLYILSQMSRADLIRCILLQPTVTLYRTSLNTGYAAQYSQRPLMNLYFTRDQSITTPRGHIICHINTTQRSPEADIIELCYKHLGKDPILRITGEGRLEGGDYIPAGNMSLIGCGMRTNDEGIRQLMEADAFGHDTVVVVRDHKFWQMQMHLDTYFNIIDSNLVTLPSTRMNAQAGESNHVAIDIYTRAPGRLKYKQTTTNGSLVKFLQDRHIQIIPLSDEDEQHFGSNYLCIAPRHIMVTDGVSEDFKKKMEHYKVKVEYIKLNELTEGNGCAHCMTQVLLRQP